MFDEGFIVVQKCQHRVGQCGKLRGRQLRVCGLISCLKKFKRLLRMLLKVVELVLIELRQDLAFLLAGATSRRQTDGFLDSLWSCIGVASKLPAVMRAASTN